MPNSDSEDDRRLRAHERDSQTAREVVRLAGQIHEQGTLHGQRLDQIDTAVKETKEAVHDVRADMNARVDKHERDEKPYWEKLDTVRRISWMNVAVILVLSALIPIGLYVVDKALSSMQVVAPAPSQRTK